MAGPRVDPLPAPYADDVQATFDKIMPPGVPPLSLFTTLARVPRVWERFRAGSLLDRGPLSLRHREIVIDRTTARRGWAALQAAFTLDQILEAILLVGFYHSVSFFANALRLAPESYAPPFPSA
jgi:hypothetical protein